MGCNSNKIIFELFCFFECCHILMDHQSYWHGLGSTIRDRWYERETYMLRIKGNGIDQDRQDCAIGMANHFLMLVNIFPQFHSAKCCKTLGGHGQAICSNNTDSVL